MAETPGNNPEALTARPDFTAALNERHNEVTTDLRTLLEEGITAFADQDGRASSKIYGLVLGSLLGVKQETESKYADLKTQTPGLSDDKLEDLEATLMKENEAKLQSIMKRVDLAMALHGDGASTFDKDANISTSAEVLALVNFLENSINSSEIETEILKKASLRETLTQEEVTYLAAQVRATLLELQSDQLAGKKTSLMKASAMLLLGTLPAGERLKVFMDPQLTGLEQNQYTHLIYSAVVANGLTIGQGQFALQALKYTEAADGLNNEAFAQAQKQLEALQRAAAEKYEESFGHNNPNKSVLSFAGAGGALLMLNGTMGAGGNIMANITDPVEGLALNPALWGSFGLMALGSEISGNFGGVGPGRLSKLPQYLSQNTNEEVAETNDRQHDTLKRELGNLYSGAKFYHNNAQAIFDISYQKTAMGGLLKLEPADLQPLPGFEELVKSYGEERAVKIIQDMALAFFGETEANILDPQAQRDFINLALKEQGLPNFA